MMLKTLSRFMRQHDWLAVIVEILVVMLGLLLAFQLDRWREGRADRQKERTYVDRLIADVSADIPGIEHAIALATLRQELTTLLMAVSDDPSAATQQPALFLAAMNQAAFTYTPTLTSHTFENLRSTGDLRLIRGEPVKKSLFDYYGFDRSQEQFRSLQLQTEARHFQLAAGVLSHDQEVYVQDTWFVLNPKNVEAARASETRVGDILASAKRLQERRELVAWLPYVRHLQVDQLAVHRLRLERAHAVLTTMNVYAKRIR